ncbi:hypothetical protein A3D72_00790 [Candidatus Uhrbacteria bacterium RIFCSPHIGHO2_02_FULL_57_19]|uniref:Phosphonate ABC transporter substrate-binding protein n=2 Tax=Parcubacteria group TaxID=1794811 RepID=A0A1F6CQB0_9BACT|nr:MAG: hypothetical protein A2704_06540 [Candidatus Kaiserbacteria bacterium RIFCSPHIGHO2_01_FULL_54_36b]OGL74351.1 MAG: hypothetical protein A3D72_00790 [Candidatus Uhrbacteria bacterium RIFCSPHIGHO2_02_FULL_57_19]
MSYGSSFFFQRSVLLEAAAVDVAPPPAAPKADGRPELRVIIASRYSPSAGAVYYNDLLKYLGERLERRITLLTRSSYAEAMKLIEEGGADIGFICSGSYVLLREKVPVEVIAAPEMYGRAEYRSYIIVPADSSAASLEDLRGKSFAFTDPLSFSGAFYPSQRALQLGDSPEKFWSKVLYTHSADKSISAVAYGLVDGAAVDGLIWDNLSAANPDIIARTKVIERSPWFGIPPIVAGPGQDPALVAGIRKVFLGMRDDPQGAVILDGMRIDRFNVPPADWYDGLASVVSLLRDKGLKITF